MNSSIIIGIILIFVGIIYFSNKKGLKKGLVYAFYIIFIGILAGLISIYFSDNLKWILSFCLIIIAVILNYPPSRKYIISKMKSIFNQ